MPKGKAQLRSYFSTYLDNNKGWISSQRVLVATAKATIRGQLMRDAAITNTWRLSQQNDLEGEDAALTCQYTAEPSSFVSCRLERAQIDLNALFISKAEYALQWFKGHHYEQGEKACHLLVTQLRQQEAALAIPAIWAVGSTIAPHSQDTVFKLANFYWALYTSEEEDPTRLATFLDGAHIPSLDEDSRNLLEGEISKVEDSAGHL
ncbi:hypothetical protein NDU88_002226 [Pleurodeles waltl]|uniref:Uncharacterized protein n=1 Tax=Pleurodeles waltl TaxID=8319 RepID=A0AAV7VCQ3_PLEWA|nr:hypothetical protein NDU88_002226 [Pleurodeles waltl]